ncbi:ABC transporter ATP-binding protein [Phytoactinopolyspora endophytica]|uniref:ABC transporter ATP-binding protein n=1 Tax=Phytoactinopolyspora endophytica TaxID=1642495 RepID=UPI00101D2EAB|nr:ABC transporter ATP-binding protein [Phytoactinopolyspora endophytica]
MDVIEVQNLHKRYGETVAVEDVSFTVEKGEIFGILGPNGAGKTTTVECVEGLRRPDAGSVSVLGMEPARDRTALTQRLGVQLQEGALQEKLKVREAMELYASFYPEPADGDELLELLGLAGKRNTYYKKLSGGQKQRLSIALALIGNPEIAVLDELTTGLDPQARRDTWTLVESVRDRGVTIVLVTHFMDEAERLCDRLALIDEGRVAAVDTPAGLVDRAGGEQRVRFRPSAEPDGELLAAVPEVSSVSREGDHVVVSGTGNLVPLVVNALSSAQIVPIDMRVEQANLEDAFVMLTGKALEFDTAVEPAGAPHQKSLR